MTVPVDPTPLPGVVTVDATPGGDVWRALAACGTTPGADSSIG